MHQDVPAINFTSGLKREGCGYSLDKYLETKSVLIRMKAEEATGLHMGGPIH